MDGTKKTCVQDSLVVAARFAGATVIKSKVVNDLMPSDGGEVEIGQAVLYAREQVSRLCVCVCLSLSCILPPCYMSLWRCLHSWT